MAWRGSFSRSLISAARVSTGPSLSRLRPPRISAPSLRPRRLSFSNPRTIGELGCMQSLMPFAAGAPLTSHLSVSVRACCELYHGWNKEDG